MIQEISNFVQELERNDSNPLLDGLEVSDGLKILIDLDEFGKPKENDTNIFLFKKGKIYDRGMKEVSLDYDFALREHFSSLVSMNKPLDSKKKIHSSSPFVLKFKKQNLRVIQDSFDNYFETSIEYTPSQKEKIISIRDFCREKLPDILEKEPILKGKEIGEGDYITIYFNAPLNSIEESFQNYLSDKLFNKNDYNEKNEDGEVVGLSDFLNGANEKKPFLLHKSTEFKVNNRITFNVALHLHQFRQLLEKRKLPNPLPIFIYKEELNNEMVRIFNREGVLRYQEIIRKLMEAHKGDISNYYLINWMNRNGIVINDFDFVSRFNYELSGFKIRNLLEIKDEKEPDIRNIFQFESEIVEMIFNKAIVARYEDKLTLRYFGDIEAKTYKTAINYQNCLKYRKAFYDYIYKSKEEAITRRVFYDLMVSTIMDDVKHDVYDSNRNQHSKEYYIKKKLNILFSLNKNFDKGNKNFGGNDMASLIPEFRKKLKRLFENEDSHIEGDEEFAFDAGQLIYYILCQSEAANKTHALIEPYISKNDPGLFKTMISRGIDQYKHSLSFGHRRLQKLASEVLGFECTKNIKELLPIILAGYFSKCLIFEKEIDKNKFEGEMQDGTIQ